MTLTNYERETIILFNEAEDTATVDVCNPALIRKLDKQIALQENQQASLVQLDENGARYHIPKKWIKIIAPPVLTEAERAKRSAAARARFGHGPQEATP